MTDGSSSPSPAGLRVGYVLTHYPRLAQTFISDEIDGLQHLGVQVRTFVMNVPDASDRRRPAAMERIAASVYLKPQIVRALGTFVRHGLRHPIGVTRVTAMALGSAGWSLPRAFRRTSHLLQAALVARNAIRYELDYLHAQFGLAPATIVWLASALTATAGRRLPFGFTIHGFHDFVDRAESRLDRKARDADQVLCVSDFTRSQLCLVTEPDLWSRFAVARCGIDLSTFSYRDPVGRAGPLTVLAVGRLSAEKGFDVLIEAISRLKNGGTPHRLILVGDGPMRQALQDSVRNAGISDHVQFVGEAFPDEVREYLTAADLFCLPSFSEGLPISIMEAMAIGVPVVTTWIAGIPELAENRVTALTVPPARADAIADALQCLADDPLLRLRLARAARLRVEEQHDQLHCAAQLAERFAAVASR